MILFECDYHEGAVPEILERMVRTNLDQTSGYGCDAVCESARAKIRAACGAPEAGVYFLVGGTQTNATVIASILRPHEGVVAAATGHIAVHEAGAVEATGHKVIALPGDAKGKLAAATLKGFCDAYFDDPAWDHMTRPGLVYLSNPTECGTWYSKAELQALRAVCDARGIPLYIDGARLGYGLVNPECDMTLPELARLADVFYIGGTKQGALMGEAVVFMNRRLDRDFLPMIKRHGGRFAKGRLLGLQFDVLFTDGLYFRYARHAVEQAQRIRAAFAAKGIPAAIDSPTNQQFFRLTAEQHARLSEKYRGEQWGVPQADGSRVVRFCTSWATRAEAVDALVADIAAL